jgi:uncharacterized repeat protein (TIGR03943 family)
MSARLYRTFQALILALLGLFLFSKLWDGSIQLYIHKRFVVLIGLAVILLVAIAQATLADRSNPGRNDNHDGKPWQNLVWMAVPLIISVLIPAQSLGALAVEQRGINTRTPLTASDSAKSISLEIPADQRTVLDWIRVFDQSSDTSDLLGEEVDVIGFVYRDSRLTGDQFMVARFGVTCCVADATAIGLPVSWPDAAGLSDNSWVRVRGTIANLSIDEILMPGVLADGVETVDEPQQPYLFP